MSHPAKATRVVSVSHADERRVSVEAARARRTPGLFREDAACDEFRKPEKGLVWICRRCGWRTSTIQRRGDERGDPVGEGAAMNGESLHQRALSLLETYGEEKRQEGLRQGLAVAERIAGWLTRQPDTPEQAELRMWAENAIRSAKERAR